MPRKSYAAFVSTLDEKIGQVVAKIDEFDLHEDTIIIFLTVRCKTVAPDLRVRRARVHAVKTSDSEVRRYRSGAFEGFCTGLLRPEGPTLKDPRKRHSVPRSATTRRLEFPKGWLEERK